MIAPNSYGYWEVQIRWYKLNSSTESGTNKVMTNVGYLLFIAEDYSEECLGKGSLR